MKNIVRLILQKLLGYDNYLFWFSVYTIKRLHNNRHEREFLEFINMLPNEGTILDIGANIGVMTVAMARKCPNARVLAFEPMPNNVKGIKRILAHYKLQNVTLFENALGDKAGSLEMVLPVIDKMKMQGLSHVVKPGDDSAWNKGEYFTVPVYRLDDMPELKKVSKISGIKIDVENFEYFVFKGGEELLRRDKPKIYCELWQNEQRDNTLAFMKGLGYTVNVFDGSKLVPFTGQNETNFFLL